MFLVGETPHTDHNFQLVKSPPSLDMIIGAQLDMRVRLPLNFASLGPSRLFLQQPTPSTPPHCTYQCFVVRGQLRAILLANSIVSTAAKFLGLCKTSFFRCQDRGEFRSVGLRQCLVVLRQLVLKRLSEKGACVDECWPSWRLSSTRYW